ncbi:Hypothetical protein, putative [Bodo saltans]|uniref:Uncharacterized protein n=1 Tax=Bodo saltans TaxID=75058 RepID=A0A0S4IZ54_BODSA|nr:Hypothetical protein, putative [Bodo saltans]|eukprot:CUG17479.1 Hypothetical protein, putative [Bodo saltans]
MHRPQGVSKTPSATSQPPPLVVVVVTKSSKSSDDALSVANSVLTGYRRVFAVASTTDDGIVPMSVVVCGGGGAQQQAVDVVFSSSSATNPSRLPVVRDWRSSSSEKRQRDDEVSASASSQAPTTSPRHFHSSVATYGLLQHNGAHGMWTPRSSPSLCDDDGEPYGYGGEGLLLRNTAAGLLRAVTLLRRFQRDTSLQHTSTSAAPAAAEYRGGNSAGQSSASFLPPLASGGNVLILLENDETAPVHAAEKLVLCEKDVASEEKEEQLQSNKMLFSGDVAMSSAAVNFVKMGATVHVGLLGQHPAETSVVVSRLRATANATGGECWLRHFTPACLLSHLFYKDCADGKSGHKSGAAPSSSSSNASITTNAAGHDVSAVASRYVVEPLPACYVVPAGSSVIVAAPEAATTRSVQKEVHSSCLSTRICPRCMILVNEESTATNDIGVVNLTCPLCM